MLLLNLYLVIISLIDSINLVRNNYFESLMKLNIYTMYLLCRFVKDIKDNGYKNNKLIIDYNTVTLNDNQNHGFLIVINMYTI